MEMLGNQIEQMNTNFQASNFDNEKIEEINKNLLNQAEEQ